MGFLTYYEKTRVFFADEENTRVEVTVHAETVCVRNIKSMKSTRKNIERSSAYSDLVVIRRQAFNTFYWLHSEPKFPKQTDNHPVPRGQQGFAVELYQNKRAGEG